MTDLTDNELRAACEAAGLEYDPGEHPAWVMRWAEDDGGYSWSWYEDDPALPSYVASLLVARVYYLERRYLLALARQHDYAEPDAAIESPGALSQILRDSRARHVIRAAMEVLNA